MCIVKVHIISANYNFRYSLPEHIREHVDFISPGIKLSAALRKTEIKRSAPSRGHYKPGPFKKLPPYNPHPWSMPTGAGSLPPDLQDCGRNITPVCLKALYDIPDANIKDSVNVMGLYESGDKYSQEDLNSFFAEYAPHVPQGTHPLLDSIDGGEAPVAPGSADNTGESDIDMDIAFSLIYVSCGRTRNETFTNLEIASSSDSLSSR
jgi:tripeptidyl-peptidase-1